MRHNITIGRYVWITIQTTILLISLYWRSIKRSSPWLLSPFVRLQHTLCSRTPFLIREWSAIGTFSFQFFSPSILDNICRSIPRLMGTARKPILPLGSVPYLSRLAKALEKFVWLTYVNIYSTRLCPHQLNYQLPTDRWLYRFKFFPSNSQSERTTFFLKQKNERIASCSTRRIVIILA